MESLDYKNSDEIKRYIDEIYAGGYNRYHEFEYKYSDENKIKILSDLFDHWEAFDDEVRSFLAYNGLGNYVYGKWCCFDDIVPLIIQHADKPEVLEAIEPLFQKGLFAVDLLKQLVQEKIKVVAWEESIRNRWTEKSFKEINMDTNVLTMYRNIDQYLKALGA